MSDFQPSTDLLIAHHAWVRALARRLVEDESQADDLVQEAWIVTSQNSPASIRSPKRWLAGVLRNLARQSQRSEVRRRRREKLAVPDSSAGTIERARLGRELAGEVLALDEPFRSALLLRFYEDLPPREIAKRTGASVKTVDSRIERGLRKLRERWKQRHGEGDTWRRGLGLIARPSDAHPATEPTTAASSPALPVITVAMKAKLALAVVLLVGSGLTWLLGGRRSEVPPVEPTGGVSAASALPGSTTEPVLNIPEVAVVEEVSVDAPSFEARRQGQASTDTAPAAPNLVVRVVDASSDKVLPEVPLLLRSYAAREVPTEVAVSARTNANGVATFPNARHFLCGEPDPWSLVHDIQFEEQPRLLLTPEVLEKEVVLSVQPASGSIEVSLQDPDGKPLGKGYNAHLALLATDVASPGGASNRHRWRGSLDGDITLFRYVELARTWEAQVRRDHSNLATRLRKAGPVFPDEFVPMELTLDIRQAVAAFRAVDEARVPLAEIALGVERRPSNRSGHSGIQVLTDADGKFTVPVETGLYAHDSILVSHWTSEGVELLGEATLGELHPYDPTDTKEIVLEEPQFVASGIVIDESGDPVDHSWVMASETPRYPWDASMFAARSPVVETLSAANGSFTLRGELPKSEFMIWAFKGDRRSEQLAARLGDTGHRLVLAPVWTVSGTVLTDVGLPHGVRIDLEDGEFLASSSVNGDGHFEVKAVPSGRYTLVCSLQNSEVARIENVFVNRNIDVGSMDLCDQFHRHELLLSGADPTTLRGEVWWRPCGLQSEWTKTRLEGMRVQLVTTAECVDVRLLASGHRTETILGIRGVREVELRPTLQVRVVLRTDGELPLPPIFLRPVLRRGHDVQTEPVGAHYFTDENRELVFRVSLSGRLQVRWQLIHLDSPLSFTVLGEYASTIDVLDQVGEQVFIIDLDGDAVTALTNSR